MTDPTNPKNDDTTRRSWLPEEILASVALLFVVVVTFANVIVRYFTNFTFAWTEDFSVFAMVLLVFAGAAGPTLRNKHIRIEILYDTKRQGLRRLLRLVSRLAMAAVFAVLAVLLVKIAYDEWYWSELASSIDVPRWIFTAPMALLAFLLVLRAVGLGRRAEEDPDPVKRT